MRKGWLLFSVLVFVLVPLTGCAAEQEQKQDKAPSLEDMQDKVSYSIGLSIGKDFKNQEIEVDTALLARGIKDALSGADPLLSEKEMQEVIAKYREQRMAAQKEKMAKQGEENIAAGEKFQAEFKEKEGVETLPSGLQYRVIEEGDGESPEAGDTVKVHYRGKLVDGTEFDSSYKRGEPATFPVSGVIPGWTEALQMMKEGGKWEVVIPPKLAYGERGAGPLIGPNATLVFEVELLEVLEEAEAAAMPKAEPQAQSEGK